eukprot:scaffold11278_cov145-Isochrysis_galbana.AAC.8
MNSSGRFEASLRARRVRQWMCVVLGNGELDWVGAPQERLPVALPRIAGGASRSCARVDLCRGADICVQQRGIILAERQHTPNASTDNVGSRHHLKSGRCVGWATMHRCCARVASVCVWRRTKERWCAHSERVVEL